MTADDQMYIGGRWVDSSNGERFTSTNPFDGKVWATLPQASADDVESAIASARRAFDHEWRHFSGEQRAELLFLLAELLESEAEKLARLELIDSGKVIRESLNQIRFAARNYRFFAGYADKPNGEVIPLDNEAILDYTLREPVGVVALVTAWNSPIQLLTNKLAPALAAGNTAVIKPSENASATTLEFCSLVTEAGFPPGVINVVTGDGGVGKLLTKHPGVDKVSLTGGPATGRAIAANASENLVPVVLELGGKSPNIVFEDADLERAVDGALAGIFGGAGQTCVAGSRLLVQRSVYDKVLSRLVARVGEIRLGDPLDPETEMGPIATKSQYERVLHLIRAGIEEGAKLVAGGVPAEEFGVNGSLFIRPTVFTDVDSRMEVAQQEIFGPVLVVLPFNNEDEAVEIANATDFGLAAGLWTNNLTRTHRLVRRLHAGTVWINTYRTAAAQAPFGGVKRSGYGRERGWPALLEYTNVKNVMIDFSEDPRDPFSVRT